MSGSPSLVFLHANGYPTGVYSQFLKHLGQTRAVLAPEIITTPLDTPAPKRWGLMIQGVTAWLDAQSPERLDIVGHSMGGYLALSLAQARPHRVGQVVLLDAPLATGWRYSLVRYTQLTGLTERVGPAQIAARRRDSWPSFADAQAYFESKKFVQAWAHRVAEDFYAHGLTCEEDGTVRLRLHRDIERDIYAYIGHRETRHALAAAKKHGISVSFIAGEFSEELRLAGRAQNRRLFGKRFFYLPGGHLLPLEAPLACANEVERALAIPA